MLAKPRPTASLERAAIPVWVADTVEYFLLALSTPTCNETVASFRRNRMRQLRSAGTVGGRRPVCEPHGAKTEAR